MPISFNQYIDITSTSLAVSTTAVRELVIRAATTNPILPPESFISFNSLSEVESYFGNASEEYYRAREYFAYFLTGQTNPDQIQFARWTKVATAPMIFCIQNNGTTLADWTSIDDGAFSLTMGGFTFSLSALDFTEAASLAAVATIIEDAIQAETGGGSMWTAATVTYSAVYGGFLLVGGAVGVYTDAITVIAPTSGTDITIFGLLGWIPQQVVVNGVLIPGAIWARGSAAESITEYMQFTNDMSTNFASYVFCWNCNVQLSEAINAAALNKSFNNKYYLLFGVSSSTYASWQTALSSYGGTGLTKYSLPTIQTGNVTNTSVTITGLQDTTLLQIGQTISGTNIPANAKIVTVPSATSITISIAATGTGPVSLTFTTLQFPEQFPATALACVDYDGTNTIINYMYKKYSAITPSVSTDSEYLILTALNVNFFGVTQTAGQLLSFYQPGILQGSDGDLLDMGLYANELWFKDRLSAKCMDVFTGNNIVPVSDTGINMISTAMQQIIDQAKTNGTIVVTKPLSVDQINKITSYTNDPNAYKTVQTTGFWKRVVIEPYDTNPVKYKAVPTVVYAGADGIRKVQGTDLIV